MALTTPEFRLDGVDFAYRNVAALTDINLTIAAGERIALIGANGSGKSTLLRLLAGLHFATKGIVRFGGQELTERALSDFEFSAAFRRTVGFVFQNPDVQLFCPTLRDDLAFGPLHAGWSKDRIRAAVAEALARFDLAHLADRPPHRLSGGQKKRAALASVLILDPEVLILDEPTATLDPRGSDEIASLMENVGQSKTGPRCMVFSCHELDLVARIASRVVVLEEGRLVADGTPADVLTDIPLLRRVRLVPAEQAARA